MSHNWQTRSTAISRLAVHETGRMSLLPQSLTQELWQLLPSQLRQVRNFEFSGERRLCLAMLEDALLIISRHGKACITNESAKRLYEEALEWFASEDIEPFTFLWTCDIIGFDASSVREREDQTPQLLAMS